MAVQTRTTALQNEVVRLYCQFENNGVLTNPASQPTVQIIDTDGVTVLSTVNAQLQSTGIWYADYFVPALLPLGQYYDQWNYQWSSDGDIEEKTMVFSVFALESYINFVSPDIAQQITPRVVQLMKDLTNNFIYESMHIPVYWEQGMRIHQENQTKRVKKYYYFSLSGSQYDIYKGAVYANSSKTFTVFQDVLTDDSSSSEMSISDISNDTSDSYENSDVVLASTVVLMAVGTGTPSASGTLNKISGDGPATLTYTGFTEKTSNYSTIYNFAYKNWLRDPRPILRLNKRIIDDGWFVDYDGRVYIDGIMAPEDSVEMSYHFKFFSDEEILGFLRFGLNMMNSVPPASVTYTTLDRMPYEWNAPVLLYAAILAIKRQIYGLNWQEKFVIFSRPDKLDAANDVIANLKDLYNDYQTTWMEIKKNAKTQKLPTPGILQVSLPEYTLPGGRSRFFRYLYKGGMD